MGCGDLAWCFRKLSSNLFVKEGVPDELTGIGDTLTTLEWNSNPAVGPTLPTQLGTLTALSYLYMSSGAYEMLPTEIGYCTSLDTLIMNNNNLKGFPPRFWDSIPVIRHTWGVEQDSTHRDLVG